MKNEMRKKWREGRDKGRWGGREKGRIVREGTGRGRKHQSF